MEDGALAGAGGADKRNLLTPADPERDVIKRECARPRRIGEAHLIERNLATSWRRQRYRMFRRLNLGPDRQELSDPFGGACGLRELTPHIGNLTQAAGGKRSIEDELAEPPGRSASGQHILRPDPKNDDDAGEHEKDDDC